METVFVRFVLVPIDQPRGSSLNTLDGIHVFDESWRPNGLSILEMMSDERCEKGAEHLWGKKVKTSADKTND